MITLPEQVVWFKIILYDIQHKLSVVKHIAAPEATEIAQHDYDHALAVMATLLATINAQQAVKKAFDGRDGKVDA